MHAIYVSLKGISFGGKTVLHMTRFMTGECKPFKSVFRSKSYKSHLII